jgi:hypothetical protein
MTHPHATPIASEIDRHVRDVRWLLREENLEIAGDVAAVGESSWVIHGIIPVDGEVIVAEFDSYELARSVLDTVLDGLLDRLLPAPISLAS